MRSPRLLVALAAGLGLAVPAALLTGPSPAAPAEPESLGAPGSWTKVTTGEVSSLAEPGLYRTADQVLHIVYSRQGTSSDELAFTNVSPAGESVATGVAVGGWASLPQDPKIVETPGGGMRVVFGGIRTISGGDPYGTGQMFSATSDAVGTAWTLETGALTESHSASASYGTGATTLADGTPVVSFPLNSTLTWNVGGGLDSTYTIDSCCTYATTLARDGDAVWLAYAGNGETPATAGIFVKQLLPTVGDTIKAPRSSEGTDNLTPSQATAFVARPGGGLYAAYCIGYPTCDKIGLWQPGADKPVVVPGSKGAHDVALSTGPGGRLWIAWTTYDRVKLVHTSTAGLTFGPVRTLKPPKAADSLYGISIAGSDGSADVLINNGSALYHQLVLPRLTLKASPKTWPRQTKQKVTFTVTDAGSPVGGAKVTAAGKSCTSAVGTGRCSIKFPPMGKKRFTATARADGYAAGKVRLRVS